MDKEKVNKIFDQLSQSHSGETVQLVKLMLENFFVTELGQEIVNLDQEEMLALVRQIDDTATLKVLIQLRFMSEAYLKNDSLTEPFIVWQAMNSGFEYWVGLAMAKIFEQTHPAQADDVFIMIPSSGSKLIEPFQEIFLQNLFVELTKTKDQKDEGIAPTQVFDRIQVRSHSNHRHPKEMRLHTDPHKLKGRRVWVIDDVVARGDAINDLTVAFENWGLEVAGVMVVLDKSMQGGSQDLKEKKIPISALIPVQEVGWDEQQPAGEQQPRKAKFHIS